MDIKKQIEEIIRSKVKGIETEKEYEKLIIPVEDIPVLSSEILQLIEDNYVTKKRFHEALEEERQFYKEKD